ncbi:MAG TPA: TPM domain-containing protein [Sphingomonadaceae bacterium]|nr:TPM domain-containing protein [Sphingomonadaceae bacterium]
MFLAASIPLGSCDAGLAEPVAELADAPQLELTGRVVDAADIFPDEVEARLVKLSEELEAATKVQLVIASTPNLNGEEIEKYARDLGNLWGLGDAERDDGLLLLVAPNERKVRIAVGLGLEETLPDEDCMLVIDEMLPLFKQGNIPEGTELGARRLNRMTRERMM